MDLQVHIDGLVPYRVADGKTYVVPLGPCSARVRADAIELRWRDGGGPVSAALSAAEFARHREQRTITAVRTPA